MLLANNVADKKLIIKYNINMNENIKKQLEIIPNSPGSYQFYDKNGEIIYIGKAKNLHRRVSSYFLNKKNASPKLMVMVPQIADIKYIVVDTEIESLILESQLIKKHKPKYNVLLKDDKKFPYFVVTKEEYPRIIVARKANKNFIKGRYFGPYTDARAMHATLEILQKIFPLKKCRTPKFNSRPCLYYDMGQCMAPCQKLVSEEEYGKIIKNVELFLQGRQKELLKILKEKMKEYSKSMEYEKAGKMRDAISDIEKTLEKQKVVAENKNIDEDYLSVAKTGSLYSACVIEIREGRLIAKKDFEFNKHFESDEEDVIESVLRDYYALLPDKNIPKKIFLTQKINDPEIYTKWLSQRLKENVKILTPATKKQKEIMELAQKNAQMNIEKMRLKEIVEMQNNYNEIGSYVAEKLNLKIFPHLIECYDISHIQGTNTVASGVCFENGEPKKSLYRRYKLKTIEKGEVDDFKSMREILTRRFKRITQKGEKAPDLIIIDGGKGQLSSVIDVMRSMNLNLNIVSLAKREEEVFLPNKKEPVIFPLNSPALHLFQRIRDEAHRFAITYHRKLRSKNTLK